MLTKLYSLFMNRGANGGLAGSDVRICSNLLENEMSQAFTLMQCKILILCSVQL